MKKVSFMKRILVLGIIACSTLMVFSCAEEEIAPKYEFLDAPLLDDGSGTNDNADGDRGNDNDDLIDADVDTDGGNDNADGERGNDNDDVVDADVDTTSDGNDNADGERGNDNDDVIDLDLSL
jgi:hypothetical protein